MTRAALVNAETGELVEPMNEESARRLTERIRIAASNYTEAKAKVLQLVDEAKAGAAHIALGYKSWTAYLSDVLSDEPLRLARDEQRELTVRLADEGMTGRAIAPIVGTSEATVRRDLSTASDDATAAVVRVTTGLDGRERTTVVSGHVKLSGEVRAKQIAELVDRGASSEQIARELGISEQQVRNVARRADITITADVIRGKRHRLDHNRVLDNVTEAVEVAAISLRDLDPGSLDRDAARERLDSLTSSIKALADAVKKIKESFHE